MAENIFHFCYDFGTGNNSKLVKPGWGRSPSGEKEFSSPENEFQTETNENFTFNIYDKNGIKKLMTDCFNKPWVNDYEKMKEGNLILIKGLREVELKGIGIEQLPGREVVQSVFYSVHAQVLIELRCPYEEAMNAEIKKYLDNLSDENDEAVLPKWFTELTVKGILYSRGNIKNLDSTKYLFEEFCRNLKKAELTFPIRILVLNAKKDILSEGSVSTGDSVMSYASAVRNKSGHDMLHHDLPPKCKYSSNIIVDKHKKQENDVEITCTNTERHLSDRTNFRQHPSVPMQQSQHGSIRSEKEGIITRYRSRSRCRNEIVSDNKTAQIGGIGRGKSKSCSVDDRLSKDKSYISYQNLNHQSNSRKNLHKCTNSLMMASDVQVASLSGNKSPPNCDQISLGFGVTSTEDNLRNYSNLTTYQNDFCANNRASNPTVPVHVCSTSSNESQSVASQMDVSNPDGQLDHTVISKLNADKSAILVNSDQIVQSSNYDNAGSSRCIQPHRMHTDKSGMKRMYFCDSKYTGKETVILLLGASGCGKSTMVNFIANYCLGKKSLDSAFLETVASNESKKSTRDITAYSFPLPDDPNQVLTIIDTPGLNDSSGSEIQDHVQALKAFLANASSDGFQIHGIGFVAQAHLVRLTSSERLVMDFISNLFGKVVVNNIITIITFADIQDTPPVVEAVKNYGLKAKHFFKFNNAILSSISSKDFEVDDMDRICWRSGCRNLKKCLKILKDLEPLSVNAMKSVQMEIYSKNVVEKAQAELAAEVRMFIHICEDPLVDQLNIKKIRDRIWELGTVVFYLLQSFSDGRPGTVEELMVYLFQSACKEKGKSSLKHLMMLAVSNKHKLHMKCSATVAALYPVYNHTKQLKPTQTRNTEKTAKAQMKQSELLVNLFCHKCKNVHNLTRIKTSSGFFSSFNSSSKNCLVSFKCTACQCDGDLHDLSADTTEVENSKLITTEMVIQSAREKLQTVVKGYNFGNSYFEANEYLMLLKMEIDKTFHEFVDDIISYRS